MLQAQTTPRTDLLNYYAQPGPMTDPQTYASWLNDLPTDIPSLVKVVQGVMVHIFWAERYGLNLSEERKGVTLFGLTSPAPTLSLDQRATARPVSSSPEWS